MLKIHVLNVCLGDSLVIETQAAEQRYFSIIDCKKVGDKTPTVEFLRKNNIRNIQTIFLTHFHKDHYSGFPDLICYLENVGGTVEYFVTPQHYAQADIWRKFLELSASAEESKPLTALLKAMKSLVTTMPSLTHDNKITACNTLLYEKDPASVAWKPQFHPGLFFAPVNPSPQQVNEFLQKALSGEKASGVAFNNISHAILLRFTLIEDKHYALFTGDLEGSSWRQVKNLCERLSGNEIKSNLSFIKIPHHGAFKQSTYETLLKMIDSDREFLASISCPPFSDNHPDKDSLGFLKRNFPNVVLACTNLSSHCVEDGAGVGVDGLELDDYEGDEKLAEFTDFAVTKSGMYETIIPPQICSGDHYCLIDGSGMQVINSSAKSCFYAG